MKKLIAFFLIYTIPFYTFAAYDWPAKGFNVITQSLNTKIKNIELKLDIEENLPLVYLDRILILRVLQNLLTNALGYTKPKTTLTAGITKVLAMEGKADYSGYGDIDNAKGKVTSAKASDLCPENGGESAKVDELRKACAEYKEIIKELEAELPFKLVNNKRELTTSGES